MKTKILITLAILAIAISVFGLARSAQPDAISAEIIDLQANESLEGYARADRVREFSFPQDHGPHPEFQTEWWYYTGNLQAADGRQLGYQLTFFRRAISPTPSVRASEWATNQVYFAHFAVTDIRANSHWGTERFSRGAAGLAGATGEPYRVWLENWEVTSLDAAGNEVQLRVRDSERALDLKLTAIKPPVLHGRNGLSQKTAEIGNASYYISFTRLATEGTVEIDGDKVSVSGLSWMDHEFSTTTLGANAVGWDWFSIQLDDQREVMLFQIRQADGSIEPMASGTLVEPDGSLRHLTRDQFNIQVLSRWASQRSGATYPSRWAVSIPSADVQLTIEPLTADQEMRVSLVYWEGAVKISGRSNGKPVGGKGFVEMTGYVPIKP